MTENQKLYTRWMRTFAVVFVAMTAFLIVCTNYGEPEKVEFTPHSR